MARPAPIQIMALCCAGCPAAAVRCGVAGRGVQRCGMILPTPQRAHEVVWVRDHLSGLCRDQPEQPARFTGTQEAADAALRRFEIRGYARNRNTVLPQSARGASGLSPFIRHGLLSLPRVHTATAGAGRDSEKFHDELLWQEYARHVHARLGTRTRHDLRFVSGGPNHSADPEDLRGPWDRSMACVDLALTELERDGWMVNQTRMWMASQWSVRGGAGWRRGEDHFFAHLLDGSRAANRLGWQWTIGAGTGKAYGFSRSQVRTRAPGLCDGCSHDADCPIEQWPDIDPPVASTPDPLLRHDPDPQRTAGPRVPHRVGTPEAVWLTAESLGEEDPALVAHQDLPVVFVFDEPLLARLRLSAKRLVFLAERLAELAQSRTLEVRLGDPVVELADRAIATTFAPVPGWRTRAGMIAPVAVHPWLWLRRPGSGPITSFTAWSRSFDG
jgi:deoxyribodipyrimidine photo-lyase